VNSSRKKIKPFPTISNDYIENTASKLGTKTDLHSVFGLPPKANYKSNKKRQLSPLKQESLHREVVNDLAKSHISFMQKQLNTKKKSKRRYFQNERSKSPDETEVSISRNISSVQYQRSIMPTLENSVTNVPTTEKSVAEKQTMS